MAEYRNEKNQITIDRGVAEEDIKKINVAINKLTETSNSIAKISAHCNDGTLSGKYVNAMAYKATQLKRDIDNEIYELQGIVSYIKSTISKYEEIDAELKNSMETSVKR